ncbi:hypothetical protein J3F80_003781 [Coemansia sp. RSA 2526]|nr:hypothetical protein J3F80_003781 [Coemansia sp. RSA 2526]
MSTIPTLIVAPAIVAAGVAYKYAGGSDRYGGTRLQDRQEYYVKGGASGRRGSTGSLEHQSGIDGRTGRGLHANEFIPTTMVGPGLQQYPGSAANSLAAQTGETKYRPAKFDGSSSFDSYHPQGISTKQVPEHIIGPFPRSDEERKHSSWLSRVAYKLTGDLGPIEHQNDDILRRRDEIRERAEEKVPMAQGGSGPPRIGVHKTSMYASDAPVHKASRAADDVTREGVKNADANQAAIDVTREGTRDESQSRFGNNYSADDRAGRVNQRADQSSGWFWNKKQEADDATLGAVDKAKRRASDAEYSAKEADAGDATANAAESVRQGASGAAQSATQGVSDAASSVRQGVSEAAGSVKHGVLGAADSVHQAGVDAGNWVSDKTDQAGETVSDAAESAKQHVGDTRDWFWNKKQEAGEAVSDTADAIKNRAEDAKDSAKEAADKTSGWFWNKKHEAAETISDVASDTRDWLSDKKDRVEDSASEAGSWIAGKTDDLGRSIDNSAATAARTGDRSRAWLWETKSAADETISNAAGSVERSADNASARAQQHADAARDMAADRMPRASGGTGDQSWHTRRDSGLDMPESKHANSVLHSLDAKFDDAREALRSTGHDLRAMAERAVPKSSGEGLISASGSEMHAVGGIDGTSASVVANRAAGNRTNLVFVESNSGIPVLDSTS